MNFDKEKFSEILIKIKDSYGSINQMAEKTQITAAYISKLIRLMYNTAPSPEILWKIANNSNGIVSYFDLMEICGYIKEQDNNIELYSKKIFEEILHLCNDKNMLKKTLSNFIIYFNDLKDSFVFKNSNIVKEISYYVNFHINIFKPFIILHNAFIKLLLKRNKISKDYANLYIQDSTTYDKSLYMNNNFNIKLFRYDSSMNLNNKSIQEIIDMQWLYSTTIRYWYLSYCSDDAENVNNSIANNSNYYMCPVYGRIAAGQPNWAEECIEGRIPIDPELMNIVNPEECFFLKVNGESMNKVIKNGAFALIRKTDWVEDGEIAVVLVNGYDATLKKFKRLKKSGYIMLEPQSTSDEFEPIVINPKETEVKIIGKYIGKMEMK